MVRVIDAEGCILGRLASETAQIILAGEEVRLVNCEKAIVTGKRDNVLNRYKEKREHGTGRKGPFFPRMPDRMVKRTVRGMTPYPEPRGREALDRLRCYIGTPEEFSDENAEQLDEAQPRSVSPHVEIGDISRWLGAKV